MISKDPRSSLPPGFRFHPTDEELILHYLRKKVSSSLLPLSIIADVDIYKFDPWDLPAKAPFGEKEWYFFSPRDRKYPNGARPNRAAASGYWKATGTDKLIATSLNNNNGGFNENIGVKKALVFYKGKPPKGVKTNWIMHEYRLSDSLSPKRIRSNIPNNNNFKSKDSSMRLDDWVLCRIYKKSNASLSSLPVIAADQEHEEIDEESLNLPNLAIDRSLKHQKSCSFSNLLDAADLNFLTDILNENNQETRTESDFSLMLGNFSSNYMYEQDQFLDQKLPQLSSVPMEKIGIGNKRERLDFDDETTTNPWKKMMVMSNNNYSYNNSVDQFDHSFINQQLLLSPHLQFQG